MSLRCVVCRSPFNFAAGETALVLQHVAYGHDFVHEGPCLAAASEDIFVEPGYDCAAFGRDPERRRVFEVTAAEGWAAVMPETPERIVAGRPVHFEPLRCWALTEHADGLRRVEGIVWPDEWLDEPGGAEFPEARCGLRACVGYASTTDQAHSGRLADWEALIRRRYQGDAMPVRGLPSEPHWNSMQAS